AAAVLLHCFLDHASSIGHQSPLYLRTVNTKGGQETVVERVERIIGLRFRMRVLDRALVIIVRGHLAGDLVEKTARFLPARKEDRLLFNARKAHADARRAVDRPAPEDAVLPRLVIGRGVKNRHQGTGTAQTVE